MRRVEVLLGLLLLASGAARGEEPAPERIDATIDRGVAYLLSQQAVDGTWQDGYRKNGYLQGETAFPTLTLLRCGVAPDSPAIAKAFDWILKQPFQANYDVALAVLADLSNTQFALYALKAARRLGLELDPDVWPRSVVWLLDNQEKDGFDFYLIERSSALAGFDRLGDHDWYARGARYVLDGQGKDGGIHVGAAEGTLAGTCESLLFPRRASVPLIPRTATGVGSK
jgi:hypothetical protein